LAPIRVEVKPSTWRKSPELHEIREQLALALAPDRVRYVLTKLGRGFSRAT